MHDQKKKERAVLSPEEQAAAAAEHERVGMLYKAVLHTATVHDYSMQTLEDTEKLLLAVPEAYTAYNCRRRALETIWQAADMKKSTSASAPATAATTADTVLTRQEWLCKELKLNSTVLLLNYKNYNAFVHRHWVFDQIEALAKAELAQDAKDVKKTAAAADEVGAASTATAAATASPPNDCAAAAAAAVSAAPTFALLQQLLQKERAKCEQLLQMDERNFHAWNYRRWVLSQEHRAASLVAAYLPAAVSATTPPSHADQRSSDAVFTPEEASELAYTTQKIKNNFSNYSAWHQRSLALRSAAARWQAQLAEKGKTSEADEAALDGAHARDAAHAALLLQLREDVGFLEQAIYCDPNDQSAWFYAPFVLQLLRHPAQSSAEAVATAALTDVFVHAVIELIAEVDRAGSEDECYMPYYFLLDHFINVCLASGGEAEASRAALQRYTDALCEKVAALAAAVAADATQRQRQVRCVHFLHERLCKADGLRKGLYDDMLAKVAQITP